MYTSCAGGPSIGIRNELFGAVPPEFHHTLANIITFATPPVAGNIETAPLVNDGVVDVIPVPKIPPLIPVEGSIKHSIAISPTKLCIIHSTKMHDYRQTYRLRASKLAWDLVTYAVAYWRLYIYICAVVYMAIANCNTHCNNCQLPIATLL